MGIVAKAIKFDFLAEMSLQIGSQKVEKCYTGCKDK